MEKSKSATRIKATKPQSPLLEPVKIEYAKFFKALLAGAKDLALHDWSKVVGDFMDGAAALNIATTPEELAYTLLQRSITKTLFDVVGESNLRTLTENVEEAASIEKTIEEALSSQSVEIDKQFFNRPTSLDILPALQSTLKSWLIAYGVTEASAQNISNRLPSYFQAAVMEEWRKNSARYKPILKTINSPFSKADDRELGWKNYDAYLQQLTERSVFDESFSLAQIYIPLNGYYLESPQNDSLDSGMQRDKSNRRRVVVSMENELLDWIKRPNQDDLLRVISGGPGSGKSTFARMFAAKVSQGELARVLFIELHKLDATKDLSNEITRYVRDEGFINVDPLDPEDPEQNLLIVLDGLDELASQGRVAAETARAFVSEVERTLRRKNEREVRLRILLSGRELVIQENESEFRGLRQILTLLAYSLTDEEGRRHKDNLYSDPKKLLERDLRQDWWKNYGELTGNRKISGLPSVLEREGLDEVTAQPLLNYLVALSYTRGKVKFDQTVNLNVVYADLVEAVYERGYDKKRRHVSVSHLSFDEFQRVLEEVALAAWHGDGRTTTVREIQEHCRLSNLGGLLEKFQEGASAGVTRLLAAFFFRQHGERASTGDRTFIFTHKSFGEYLTACRIVRAVERIVKQIEQRKISFEDGWGERESLAHWAVICGPSACTRYIKNFVVGEFSRRSPSANDISRYLLANVFSHLLAYGMPMERIGLKYFSEALYQSRNAEETLLVSLSAVAVVTEKVAHIEQPSAKPTAFGAWFRRIQGQRNGAEPCLAARSLSYIGLQNAVVDIIDFYGADFSHADLSGLTGHFANFGSCNLRGANMEGAVLRWAIFDGAQMQNVNLRSANLSLARFSSNESLSAQLEAANLQDAYFQGAELRGVQFQRANLKNADFHGAKLAGAKLAGADTEGAKFEAGTLQRLLAPKEQASGRSGGSKAIRQHIQKKP